MARINKSQIKVYRDHAGEYRWRLVGGNGHTIADSAEGYASKWNCVMAVKRFQQAVAKAAVVESAEVL